MLHTLKSDSRLRREIPRLAPVAGFILLREVPSIKHAPDVIDITKPLDFPVQDG
jgi:hypothetical protein